MPFIAAWSDGAAAEYAQLRENAEAALGSRQKNRKQKAGKAEGLFKQVHDCIQKLLNNPRHPGLKTHKYDSLENPYDAAAPVFEAYAQNRTSGAYRVFWCYGPNKGEITIIAITPHP
jgi:hypothetical protein